MMTSVDRCCMNMIGQHLMGAMLSSIVGLDWQNGLVSTSAVVTAHQC